VSPIAYPLPCGRIFVVICSAVSISRKPISRPVDPQEQAMWIIPKRFETEAAIELSRSIMQRIDNKPNAGSLFDRRSGPGNGIE
jgi:hypothetical protein